MFIADARNLSYLFMRILSSNHGILQKKEGEKL